MYEAVRAGEKIHAMSCIEVGIHHCQGSETVRTSAKMRIVIFIDVDIYHRMASLRMLYLLRDFERFSRPTFVTVDISQTMRASVKKCVLRLL